MRSLIARGSRAAIALGIAAAFTAPVHASDVKLPNTISWSAYDVGAGGYNQSVAIGNALKQKYGINLRLLPGKNDVSRTLPLRQGQVQFSANGIGGTYMSQEGIFEFGAKNWGPQATRVLMLNSSEQLLTVMAAADTGVKTVADLKGKRVAWVIGAPALNMGTAAILAHANLSWDDVQKVEFGGYAASLDGILNNQVDAAYIGSVAGKAYAIAQSPRGLVYPTIPHADKEGWKRLNAIAPYFQPIMGAEGANLSKENRAESSGYPYPILMTYDDRDPDLVYNMTKAMAVNFDAYKDAAPGNTGWNPKAQNFQWVVPFHEGAIRYWKEAGAWKPEHQAHNDKLIERQKVLAAAWAATTKGNHADDEAFKQAWMKARAEALTKAGFEPGVTSW